MPTKRSFVVSGVERSLIYRFVVETGLRANEVKSLVVGDLNLEGDRPSIRVRAATAKNGRERIQPLRRSLAADLLEHVRSKLPTAPALTVPPSDRSPRSHQIFQA